MYRSKKAIFLLVLLGVMDVSYGQDTPTIGDAESIVKHFSPVITAAPVLSITPDARSAAMGGLGLTHSADAFALYHNVSMLPRVRKTWGIALSYTPWMPEMVKDMSVSYLAGFYSWRSDDLEYAVGSSFRYFHIGKALAFPRQSQEPMQINPYELAADVGFGVAFGEHWSAGTAVRYVYSDYNYSLDGIKGADGAMLVDLSGTYQTDLQLWDGKESKLRAAVALNNLGGKMTFDGGKSYLFTPATLRLGVGLESQLAEDHSLGLHLGLGKLMVPSYPALQDLSPDEQQQKLDKYNSQSAMGAFFSSMADAPGGMKEEWNEVEWGIGAEYNYLGEFWLRAGYHYQHPDKGTNSGLSLGAGLLYEMLRLDLSYFVAREVNTPLNHTFRIALSVEF
ncbi:MAG: type IX secretion system outer membrane channel protein PorV [Porphyromonas sp.]|nr:type IX secretion system outer membrane channel protein PorV [Porphyromonas sp.]